MIDIDERGDASVAARMLADELGGNAICFLVGQGFLLIFVRVLLSARYCCYWPPSLSALTIFGWLAAD